MHLNTLTYEQVEVTYPSQTHSFNWHGISLNKLIGDRKIVDIVCRIGSEFSDTDILINTIILSDGSTLSLQGEHDIVYLNDYNDILPSEDVLQNIYDTDPDNQ